MAKAKREVKKAVTAKKKSLTFSALNAALTKINPESVILSENTNRVKIDNWIGLGNYMLNAQISGSIFKGIPENRITMLVGPSQCLHPDQEVYVYIGKSEDKKEIQIE